MTTNRNCTYKKLYEMHVLIFRDCVECIENKKHYMPSCCRCCCASALLKGNNGDKRF